MNNWLNIIQNKLLPPRCILCDSPGLTVFDLCQACYDELPRNLNCCRQCGARLSVETTTDLICGQCLEYAPGFDTAFIPYLYQGGVRHLITRLKFNQQYKNARLLADLLLTSRLESQPDQPQCLIPVPLHPNRYQERSFNQSIEIGRHLARQLQIPLSLDHCLRIRDTPHQTELNARQRQQNLQQAFAIKQPLPYQHIAIIDDVVTTGTTASILAKTLKHHGVSRVDIWACARA